MMVRSACCLLVLFACCAWLQQARAESGDTPEHPRRRLVRIETSLGDIDLELFEDQAPATVQNFLTYATENFYDGTIFHRVAQGVVIQGGGFTPDLKEKSPKHSAIKSEAGNGLLNIRGTIGMARGNDPDSATCQFYINAADNIALNHLNSTPQGMGYCVFGRVVTGMSVVDKINAVEVDKGEKKEDGQKSEPKLTLRDGSEVPSVEIPKQTVLIKAVRELTPTTASNSK